MKFYTSVEKKMKLKVRNSRRLILTFEELTRDKPLEDFFILVYIGVFLYRLNV